MFKRKKIRLQNYHYGQAGCYFLTICTHDRKEILGDVFVDVDSIKIKLSAIGEIAEKSLLDIPNYYAMVKVEGYVIMPNHIHLLLMIENHTQDPSLLSKIINQWKGAVSKMVGFSVWQKSFHDHVVRDIADYERLQEYMANNPAQWHLDSLHPANFQNEP
ncbi:MAG: hypothetical protein RL217_1844 [Pseudomonadota bacterium]|jgi:REP element-mobilizing transposase RayT